MQEDFDEFCDPDNPRIIKYEQVMDAADRLRPFIINTPCMVRKQDLDHVILML